MAIDHRVDSATQAPWQEVVRPVLADTMRAAEVPGIVFAVTQGEGLPQHLVLGTDGADHPLAADTLFPVASITKPVTALAVLRLVDDGALALDDPLAHHLPEAAAASDGVTVRTLLCHIAGLPEEVAPQAAPYTAQLDWPALAAACLATPPARPPRTWVLYSNVGYGLLAVLVERLTGKPFATALVERVLAPLQVEAYLGSEPPRPVAHIRGDFGEHTGTALEPFNSAFWRSLALPWGGLITTAAGVLTLVRAFAAESSGFLSPALRAEAVSDQTRGLAGRLSNIGEWRRCPWGLGVSLHGEKTPDFVPAQAAPSSFGHGGSSGSLVWHDPVASVSWAILGARTIASWWTYWPAIGAAILDASATA